jgi:hypothetical protein
VNKYDDFIAGIERAIAIIQNEDYPESHGMVSVAMIVNDLRDEIELLLEEA